MKKSLSIIILFAICFTMFSCSTKTVNVESEDTPIQTQTETNPTDAPTEATTQSQTEAPTQTPTQAPTQPPTQTPAKNTSTENSKWKSLYIQALNNLNHETFSGFCLIEIDDNNIPELYAASSAHISKGKLFWVCDNQLCQYDIQYNGLRYIKKQNLLLHSGGFQGHGFDEVLSISNNKLSNIATGNYSLDANKYEWNGSSMSASEYECAKDSAFNTYIASTPMANLTYTDVCQQITDW